MFSQDTVDGVNIQIEISQALKDLDGELNLENITTTQEEQQPTVKDIKVRFLWIGYLLFPSHTHFA